MDDHNPCGIIPTGLDSVDVDKHKPRSIPTGLDSVDVDKHSPRGNPL